MSPPSPSDNLTILVEPSSGIMRVAWARPLLTAGLIDSYYELLEMAAYTGRRFWHFDLRLRIWPAATFTHWLTETFAPLATQRLGGPIYVACWMGGAPKSQRASSLTVNLRQQTAKVGFYPAFFSKESDARTWLLYQQEAEEANARQLGMQ